MNIIKASVLILVCATAAQADPYYKTFFSDMKHPITVTGAFIDPLGKREPQFGTSLALVYHNDPAPVGLLSNLVSQHALTVGGGYGSGNGFGSAGAAVNLSPATKAGLLWLLERGTKDSQLSNIKGLLAPPQLGSTDLTLSFGPQWTVVPISGSSLLPINKWQGSARIFVGAALYFSQGA